MDTGHFSAFYPPASATVHGKPLAYTLRHITARLSDTNDEGSERTIAGEDFPFEIQLVHWSTTYPTYEVASTMFDGIAITSILYKLGDSPSHFLSPILSGAALLAGAVNEVKVTGVEPEKLFFENVEEPLGGGYCACRGYWEHPTCGEGNLYEQWPPIVLRATACPFLPPMSGLSTVSVDFPVVAAMWTMPSCVCIFITWLFLLMIIPPFQLFRGARVYTVRRLRRFVARSIRRFHRRFLRVVFGSSTSTRARTTLAAPALVYACYGQVETLDMEEADEFLNETANASAMGASARPMLCPISLPLSHFPVVCCRVGYVLFQRQCVSVLTLFIVPSVHSSILGHG